MNELEVEVRAAKEAGKIQMESFGGQVSRARKDDGTFVSEVDNNCEETIIGIIKSEFPESSFLGEEGGEQGEGERKWLIDPLDGTHNYTRGIPVFAVSIGMELKGELQLGVLHFPVYGWTAVAEKGKGASINGRLLKASETSEICEATIYTAAQKAQRQDGTFDYTTGKIFREAQDTRIFGAIAFGGLMVAQGSCDAVVAAKTTPYDIAALSVLVEEAGGKVTSIDGEKPPYLGNCIISNRVLHEKIAAEMEVPK